MWRFGPRSLPVDWCTSECAVIAREATGLNCCSRNSLKCLFVSWLMLSGFVVVIAAIDLLLKMVS